MLYISDLDVALKYWKWRVKSGRFAHLFWGQAGYRKELNSESDSEATLDIKDLRLAWIMSMFMRTRHFTGSGNFGNTLNKSRTKHSKGWREVPV